MFAAELGAASEAGYERRSARAAGATALGYRSSLPDAEDETNVAGSLPRSEIVKGAFHPSTVSQTGFYSAEAEQGAPSPPLPRTPSRLQQIYSPCKETSKHRLISAYFQAHAVLE
jgi:hypothetical protein